MILNCIWWWGFSPGPLANVEYPFSVITTSSTLTRNNSTCKGPFKKSYRTIQSFTILENIKLCANKGLIFELDRNTWNHFTVHKQIMSSGLFKYHVTYKLFAYKSYIYIYSRILGKFEKWHLVPRQQRYKSTYLGVKQTPRRRFLSENNYLLHRPGYLVGGLGFGRIRIYFSSFSYPSFFFKHLAKVEVVQLCTSIKTAITWKNCRFVLSKRTDRYTVDSNLCLNVRVCWLSVDEILFPRYLSINIQKQNEIYKVLQANSFTFRKLTVSKNLPCSVMRVHSFYDVILDRITTIICVWPNQFQWSAADCIQQGKYSRWPTRWTCKTTEFFRVFFLKNTEKNINKFSKSLAIQSLPKYYTLYK